MKVGYPAAHFIFDCHDRSVSDEEMRRRWEAGEYGKKGERPRPQDAKEWRRLAGRK